MAFQPMLKIGGIDYSDVVESLMIEDAVSKIDPDSIKLIPPLSFWQSLFHKPVDNFERVSKILDKEFKSWTIECVLKTIPRSLDELVSIMEKNLLVEVKQDRSKPTSKSNPLYYGNSLFMFINENNILKISGNGAIQQEEVAKC